MGEKGKGKGVKPNLPSSGWIALVVMMLILAPKPANATCDDSSAAGVCECGGSGSHRGVVCYYPGHTCEELCGIKSPTTGINTFQPGGDPAEQIGRAVGTAIGNAIGDAIVKGIFGDPQQEAAQRAAAAQAAAQAAAAAQARADREAQERKEREQQLEDDKDELLHGKNGALKLMGVHDSTDLQLIKTSGSSDGLQLTKTSGSSDELQLLKTDDGPKKQKLPSYQLNEEVPPPEQ